MDVRVVLELSSPSMEDAGKAGQAGADEALLFGEAFEGLGGGREQGLVGDLWMGADEGTQGFRDAEGDEEVRPRELFFQLMV